MTTIPLSGEFLAAVLKGRKVSTVRRGRRFYPLGEGTLRIGDRDVAVTVTRIRHCCVHDLTEEDARRDGFASVSELRTTLERFYPDLSADEEMTLVEFEYKDADDDID
jgi:hypothetical protein